MTSRDFCYWLQGYFEINGSSSLTLGQSEMIKRHLSMVFVHEIDPSIDKGNPTKQGLLNQLHTNPATPPATIGEFDKEGKQITYRC